VSADIAENAENTENTENADMGSADRQPLTFAILAISYQLSAIGYPRSDCVSQCPRTTRWAKLTVRHPDEYPNARRLPDCFALLPVHGVLRLRYAQE
jgi:hypothetical protein